VLRQDFLEPREIREAALARAIGMAPSNLCNVIKGRRHITPELALSLAAALDTDARYWMDLQADWELWQVRLAKPLPRFDDPPSTAPRPSSASAGGSPTGPSQGRENSGGKARKRPGRTRRRRPPRQRGA
jgi:addiction module HigA family antidote